MLHHAIMDSNGCSIGYEDYVIKIKAIKALGIKPDACNHAGQTALHMIAGQAVTSHSTESYERVYKKVAEFLHPSNNICVNCRDNRGRTPLHLAAALSEYRVYTLLKAGADGQSLCFERRFSTSLCCESWTVQRGWHAGGSLSEEFKVRRSD